jgi:hypothetical protein
MAHHIQVLIGSKATLDTIHSQFGGSKVIELPQNLALLPVTEELYDAIPAVGPVTPSDEGFIYLDPKIKELLLEHSAAGSLGYLETDYFGGDGDQGAILANDGEVIYGPQRGSDSINQMLRLMAVQKFDKFDEFAAVELGRYRSNRDWINQPVRPKRPESPASVWDRLRTFIFGVRSHRRS